MGRGDSRSRTRERRSHNKGQSSRRSTRDRGNKESKAQGYGGRVRSPSRRSRSPRGREPVDRRRPGTAGPWERQFPIPREWRPDDAHLDTQLQHGLSLPRLVASTAYSRANDTAGLLVQDVKFYQLLHGAQENWLMRLLANGRNLAVEAFRSRLEAAFASQLVRAMRDSDIVDLTKLLSHEAGNSSDDWSVRLNAIKSCVPKIIKFMATLMPADTATALMAELEMLRAENQTLRGNRDALPAPSGPEPISNPPKPDNPCEPSASASQRPLAAFSVGSSRPILEQHRPTSHTSGALNAWMKKHLPKDKLNQVDQQVQVLEKQIQDAGIDAPAVDRMLIAWGLDVPTASKMNQQTLLRLLAAVNLLRE